MGSRRSTPVLGSRRLAVISFPFPAIVSLILLAVSGVAGVLHVSHVIAFWVALCALTLTVCADIGLAKHRARASETIRSVALFLAVAAVLVTIVLLTIRILQIGIEVVQNYPTRFMDSIPFSFSGVLTLVFVLVACGVHEIKVGGGRMIVPLFWLVVLMVMWVCASPTALTRNAAGGFERTSTTVFLDCGVSAVLMATAFSGGLVFRRRLWHLARENPDGLHETQGPTGGFAASFMGAALWVGLLTMYHLLVPVRTAGGYRVTLLLVAFFAAGASLSCFALCGRQWVSGLGDAGFGLATLAVAAVTSLFVPLQPERLVDRYPQLFNAMMVGFAIAAGWWTWLSRVWEQQLDNGKAWTTAGRLIPRAKRFAFLSAALALLCSSMMAFWPRLPGISTMDHSYGRIVAGFSGNLFLLLVMLWASRRLRRSTFDVLTFLSVASGAGFLVIRMLPFASNATR